MSESVPKIQWNLVYKRKAPIPKARDNIPHINQTFVLHFSFGKRSKVSWYLLSPFL